MEPGATGASGLTGSAAPSFPSLSDFGLGGLTATATRPQRPPQQPQSNLMNQMPAARQPVPPRAAAPPDVDLTGLSEEEQAMIQSVMMRAQESNSSVKSQQATPQQQFPQQQQPQQQQQQQQQGQIRQPVSQQQNRVEPVSNFQPQPPLQQQRPPQQVQPQPQMGQQMQPDVRQQMQPTAGPSVTMSQQANQFPQSGQQMLQNQRPQQPQTSQPQMQFMQPQQQQQQQQPQQQTQQQQQLPQQQPAGGMQSQPTSQSYQAIRMPQSQDSRMPLNVPVSSGIREMPQPQQMSQTPGSVMGFGVTHQMEELGQKLDKQNFIETLQQQAQPIPISPAVNAGTSVLPTSMNGMQQSASTNVHPVPQFPSSSTAGTSSAPFTSTSVYGTGVPTASSFTVPITSAAASASYAFPSSSSSLSSSVSNAAAFTGLTASPLITSYGQPLSSTSVSILDPASLQNHVFPGAQQQPRSRMVHQQSWSEGTFENALQPSAGINMNNMTGVVAAGSGLPHQFNRRRSMEQMAGLPQDYGMNSVIEPFDFKMPVAAATTAVTVKQSERMTDVTEKRITSPPREYSSVSDPPLVSSLSREIPAASPDTSPAVADPSPESHLTSPPQVADCPSTAPCPVVDVPAAPLVTELPVVSGIEPVVDQHATVEPEPVTQEQVCSPPVTSPTRRVVANSPPEAWVNPFSKLLKSFDDDAHDDVVAECPVSPPPVSSVSSHPPHVPKCDPVSEAVQCLSSPPAPDANLEKRTSLTSNHSGSSRDHSPSRSSQTKSSPTTVAGDMSPHRKVSGGEVTTTSSKLDERRSSLGSNTSSNFKTRTGALLPSIPIQGRAVQSLREDRMCLRTGSLGEQDFVQQLNSSVVITSASSTSRQQQLANDLRDSLNFELDEEYENEGEQDDDDEDEDEQADIGVEKYTCDTIVEESEEESLSPRSVQNLMQNKKQLPPETSTMTPTVVTSGLSSRLTDGGSRGSVIPVSRLSVHRLTAVMCCPRLVCPVGQHFQTCRIRVSNHNYHTPNLI